jgi:hypothetical protein
MKNNTVSRVFTYKLKCILLVFVLMNSMSEMLAAQARQQQAPIPQGIFQRLIKIKYNAELYLITAQKHQNRLKIERVESNSLDKIKNEESESLDSALTIYNTIRWNMDGLVYQISGDLVAANSPKKLRQLNQWCLHQSISTERVDGKNDKAGASATAASFPSPEAQTLQNLEAFCKEYLPAFSPIDKNEEDQNQFQNRNINLTTNVFYLIKDSYSLIMGLSDLKTQQTTALVEMLDQMRLASPQELLKTIK